MKEKLIGYILLVGGLLIILFSFFEVYQILSSKKLAQNVFDLPGITIDLSKYFIQSSSQVTSQNIQNNDSKTELITSEILNQTLNFIANIIVYGFFANIGFKIAMLGVNLIRPIKVKLRGDVSDIKKDSSNLSGSKEVKGKTW